MLWPPALSALGVRLAERIAMKKIQTLALVLLLLSGCAVREYQDYDGATSRAALANVCQRLGFISYEEFSHYINLQMGWGPRQTNTVNEELMRSMYLRKVEEARNWEPKAGSEREQLKMNCSQVAVVAARVRGQSNQPIATEPTYIPRNTTTNCMTTYGWTRCNSY